MNENGTATKSSELARVSCGLWQDTHQNTQRYLEGIRLDQLIEQLSAENMYHI